MKDTKTLCGIHAVTQAILEQPEQILDLYWDKERHDHRIQAILDSANAQKIKRIALGKDKLEALAGTPNHQGVVLRLVQTQTYSEKDILELVENNPKALVLILDCIQDPHNLGACMRSALALGVDALVFPQDKSCPVTATVSKVASGAAERLPYVAVKNLARFMQSLKEAGVWCIGTSLETEKYLHQIDLTGPIAMVMGQEATGLRQLTEKNCDMLAKIPMAGPMESLNVSVATGISLYEIYRQRFT
jgi:23S rRNA (guanosine2251-2'-O)-methyltransferase